MREFKFNCPVCSQHIKSNATQSGKTMECPTCFQKIVVPQPPESDDPKYIVTATRYTEKKIPVGDVRARTGSIKDNIAQIKPPAAKKFPVVPVVIGVVVLAGAAAAYLFGGKVLKGGGDEVQWVADSLTGNEGTPVSAWKDKIGGVQATQSRAEGMPTLHSHVLNGHNVLRFSALTGQYLAVNAGDSPVSGAGDFTVVTVFSTSTPGTNGAFWQNTALVGCDQFGTVNDWGFGISGTELSAGLGAGDQNCSGDFTLPAGTVTDGRPHVGMYVRSGGTVSLYLDGLQSGTQSGLCTAPRGSYGFQIGAMTTEAGYFNGDIAEVQIYKHALADKDIRSLAQELIATYGIGATPAAPAAPASPNQPAAAGAATETAPAANTPPAPVVPIALMNPPLPVELSSGRVGVGSWYTQIAVSNVVITSGSQTLYTSDFLTPKPKKWILGDGQWVAGNGVLEQLDRGENHMAVIDDFLSSYTFHAKLMKISGNEGFFIPFNFKNTSNFAGFNIGGSGNTVAVIEMTVDGNRTSAPPIPFVVKTGQWYDVEIDVKNNNVHCYIDGQLVLSCGN